MYKLTIIILVSLFATWQTAVHAQEIVDPMQPPRFALEKYRLAKLKAKPQPQAVSVAQKLPPVAALELTSILFSASRRIAIIDDQLLGVGDSIRGARLIKINKNDVRLLSKGKVINLSLNRELPAIKKPAAGN